MELIMKRASARRLFVDHEEEQSRAKKMMSETDHQVAADSNFNKSLNDLPAEVILEILKWVPSGDLLRGVTRVSKKFYQLSLDPSLSISFRITRRTKKFAAEAFLMKRFRQISTIVIYQVTSQEDLNYLAPTIAALPKLSELKISMLPIELPKNLLGGIFEKGKLERLVVVGQRMVPDLTGIENCLKLVHVQFDHVMQIEELSCLSNMSKLRVLELTASIATSLEDFVEVFRASQWSSLEELTLTFVTMNSQCLETVATKCPALKKIWIYSIYQEKAIASSAVELILRNCHQLQFLFLAFNKIGSTLKKMDQKLLQKYLVDFVPGAMPHITFSSLL